MTPDFWHQRWAANQIGFHQSTPTPLLLKHWPALHIPRGARVFVPLAGKSLDMVWLVSQGYRVLGAELCPLAVEQFFAEHDLQPEIKTSPFGTHYRAGDIELICGDAFALDAKTLSDCAAVFDRAALIALPPEMRRRYVEELYSRLPDHCRGLLITLEYPQHEKAGPPFAVVEDEVRALYGHHWRVETLARNLILPDHPGYVDGVSRLETVVYALRRS